MGKIFVVDKKNKVDKIRKKNSKGTISAELPMACKARAGKRADDDDGKALLAIWLAGGISVSGGQQMSVELEQNGVCSANWCWSKLQQCCAGSVVLCCKCCKASAAAAANWNGCQSDECLNAWSGVWVTMVDSQMGAGCLMLVQPAMSCWVRVG